MRNAREPKNLPQGRSLNTTYLRHEPISIGSTYRIGICGLRKRGTSIGMTTSVCEAVHRAFNPFSGPKLLLMAGSLPFWPKGIGDIRKVAKVGNVTILFEATVHPRKRAYMAILPNGKPLPLRIYQSFATSADANNQPELVEELIKQCGKDGERTIHLCGIKMGLLICGEINVLSNEQGNIKDRNRPYIRFHRSDTGVQLFAHLRLVFNGAHTKMGEWSKLDRRFRFLSSGKRWALYATNNDKTAWGTSTLRAYYNGIRVATSRGPEPNWDLPVNVLTSTNDRCRILTLDLPAHCLE